MKYFAAIFLFAFVIGIDANDVEDLSLDDEVVPDRHPYVQCKIDLYDCLRLDKESNLECLKKYKTCMAKLVPTVPPYVIACKNNFLQCRKDTPGLLNKTKCYSALAQCLLNKGPSMLLRDENDGETPDRHPYVQCKIDLYDCLKAGKKKLECLRTYKTCMAQLVPTIPPFVKACNDDLKECLSTESGVLDKAQCFKTFGKCLINKGPGGVVLDAIEDMGQMSDMNGVLQCKKDLYNCFKDGKDKKGCLKDYGGCMDALIPPFVKQCSAKATECFANASGWRDKVKCAREYAICLKNGAPTQAPPEPSAAP